MKWYVVFFLILKVAILVQFALILFNKQTTDSRIYILTEIIFKTGLFLFIELLMFHATIRDLAFEDKVIVSFAGGLLLYDAWFNDFPKLLTQIRRHAKEQL